MSNIIWFRECHHKLINLVGGKNASLGELYQLSQEINMNISNGFAITTNVYNDFLKYNNLEQHIQKTISSLNPQDLKDLHQVSETLQNCILGSSLKESVRKEIISCYETLKSYFKEPIQVAVRSSAIAEDLPDASFAGQQDTYLNINNCEQLISCIIQCFASLFNSRAISYRATNNIPYHQVSISVGIQKMIRSDLASAGVAFSVDPNTGFSKAIVINSAWGLGEIVVSGGVKPDEFIVDKRGILEGVDDPILGKTLGNKKTKIIYSSTLTQEVSTSSLEYQHYSLESQHIKKLSQIILDLEKHYRQIYQKEIYVDIEWALDGIDNELYIIQCRPETVHSSRINNDIYTYKLNKTSEVVTRGVSVGDKITSGKVKILSSLKEYHKFEHGDILVTQMTTPDWEPLMKISSGVITNKGGKTCHAAIVARELGINACVGTGDGTEQLTPSEQVTLDNSNGDISYIYRGVLDYTIEQATVDINQQLPVSLMLNIGNPESCFQASLLPSNGVGLTRMEFIINNYIKVHPLALWNYPNLPSNIQKSVSQILEPHFKSGGDFFVDKLSHALAKIASSFYPNNVIIRLSDFKSNEYRSLLGGSLYEPIEENPMIGWRGASRYYSNEYLEAFKLECQAIKYAREKMGMRNIIIMIPFCRTPEECQQVIEILDQQKLSRGDKGLQIYLMCEIPSNVIEADRFSPFIDGVSIGGNDLLQLTLGIDRDSDKVSQLSQHTNLSYRRLICQAIKEYKKRGIKVGFCGQQPSDSFEFCNFLISEGVDSISVTSDSFLKTYKYLSEYNCSNK